MGKFEGEDEREVYVEMHRAASELVHRFEQYLDLVAKRPNERATAIEKLPQIRHAERVFRGFSERCRDVREAIEDAIDETPMEEAADTGKAPSAASRSRSAFVRATDATW